MNKCIPYKYTFLVLFILIGYVYCADQPNDQSKDVKGIGSVDCDSDQGEDNFQVTELTEISKDDQRQDDILQNSNEIIIGEEETPVALEEQNQEAQEETPVALEEQNQEAQEETVEEQEQNQEAQEETVEEQEQNQEAQEETVEEQEQVPMIYYGPQYQTQPIPMSQHIQANYYVTGFDHNHPRYGPEPIPIHQPYQPPYQPVPQYYPGPQYPVQQQYYPGPQYPVQQPQYPVPQYPVQQPQYPVPQYPVQQPQYPVPIQQYPLPQPIQPQQQPTPQYYPEPYQQMPQPIPIPQPQQPTYQSPQGYQPQQPYYGPMLQPPPVTRYPLPPPQPAPQQPYYGPIPHPITQYAPPKHVQGYIRYPFIQQERILTHPSIISYPHVQFRLSGPKPQPKLPFPEPRGYFRPGNPIFARHNTKSYSQNKYISQSSSDQSDEQQTKEPTQAESSSHQPTQRPEETKEPTTQLSQEPTQHTQLTSEPSGLEPETIPVEVGSDEDEEHPQPPKEPGDGDQPPNKPEGADEGDEEGEGDDDEEEYEEDKKPSKVVKKCNKISLLKKNEEGELIEMIEGEDYKVIWKNLNKSKYEFIGNLEEILCDDELVYTNRPENGYPSLLTYNITLSVFVLRRQGGHVVVKCVDGKWIPEGRKIPGFMKMFIKDYFGNEIELVEGDYFLDLTACKSYKYTFAVGIACTRIEVRGETVWEKTDDDPFPISCCITFKMNLIVNFGQYKKIFAKRRGVFKLLIIKNK
uniref:Tash protein PEST motif containing protein, putative n=1 Tax=Theileria annulata TaxID=5874 RepID=A0A3B0N5G7_THEAN